MKATHHKLSKMVEQDLRAIAKGLPNTGQNHEQELIWRYKYNGWNGVNRYLDSIAPVASLQPLQETFLSKWSKWLDRKVDLLTWLLNQPCAYHISEGGFWFRIFGYGLTIMDRSIHPPLFSERNGYVKVYRVGKWAIKTLKP